LFVLTVVSIILVVSVVALLIIWGGYPLGVFALASLRRRPQSAPSDDCRPVSIILASGDDVDAIRARISNLLASSYPSDRLEIVVGIDVARSRSSVGEIIAGMDPKIAVVAGDSPGGKAATLNAAVRLAHHNILVFADTAQTFDRDAVTELVRALDDPRLGAVSGSLEVLGDRGAGTLADYYWRYERWLRKTEARLKSAVGVTGAVYAMRQRLWTPLPAGLILDDVYVPMRLALNGWRVGFADRARAFDSRRFTPRQEYRRKVRTLTGVIQLCVWMPELLSPARNPLWIQFMFHKLLRLLTPYLAALSVVAVLWKLSAMILANGIGTQLVPIGAIAIGILAVRRVRRAIAAQIRWGWTLQTSIVVATINGIRGRWDVWQR
jgi:cellulose synthase/poly-beta-1,6-N-acetylglucosamine synthase-like glycosyltransferase